MRRCWLRSVAPALPLLLRPIRELVQGVHVFFHIPLHNRLQLWRAARSERGREENNSSASGSGGSGTAAPAHPPSSSRTCLGDSWSKTNKGEEGSGTQTLVSCGNNQDDTWAGPACL